VTEKLVHDHVTSCPPPTGGKSGEMRTSGGLRAPCQYRQGAFRLVYEEPAPPRSWPSSDEFDIKEAARNFEAYLNILREWDEKEKRAAGQSRAD